MLPGGIARAEDEDSAFVSGVIPEQYTLTYPEEPDTPFFQPFSTLPSSYISPSVSGVRNQAQNGICWTFAATAAIEANIRAAAGPISVDLSELHIAHSTSNKSGNTRGFNRAPDDGGHRGYVSAYLMRSGIVSGTVAEISDPYTPFLSGAKIQPRPLPNNEKPKNYTVQNTMFLSGDNKSSTPEHRTTLKNAIVQYGVVACSMYWEESSYNAATGAYRYNGSRGQNHAVTLVGWDDNYSSANFRSGRQPKTNGAWLVKNSWGNNWGIRPAGASERGFFWISYEDTQAPITSWVVDGVQEYDPDAIIYEYDPHGYTRGMYNSQKTTIFAANVFTREAADDGDLEQIKFFLPDANTSVNIYVVPHYTGELTIGDDHKISYAGTLNISDDKKVTEIPQSYMYSGWYTYNLNKEIQIGERFAIILEYTVTGGSAQAPMQGAVSGWSSIPNVSYTSFDGNSWVAVSGGNANIKAVTKPSVNLTNGDAVERAKDRLTWETIRGSNRATDNVRSNLNLITAGASGTTISWSSSNSNVIDNDGNVTRPDKDKDDEAVRLTATISRNTDGSLEASATVIFDLTVISMGAIPDGVIVPSDWEGVYIDLENETIELDGIIVAAYSLDGKKWKAGELPQGDKFKKLFNKEITLRIAQGYHKKSKTASGIITFPKIKARPKANFEKLKPFYLSDEWVLKTRTGAAPKATYEWVLTTDKKTPADGWERFDVSDGGEILSGKKKETYLFRTPASAEDGVYTPTGKIFKIKPANFSKEPKFKVTVTKDGKQIIKMKKDHYVQIGDDPARLISVKRDLEVTAGTTVLIWKAETGKKPRSEIQSLTVG
jgi:C1A family cysteine protease